MTTQKITDSLSEADQRAIEERKEIRARKKRVGRPPKAAIKAKSKGSRGAVGRPKGDTAIMNDFRARMLASPKSTKVLEAIFEAALDPNHKGQTAAWKLIMDRIAPASGFEKLVGAGTTRGAININITGIESPQVDLEGEWEPVEP